jgi:hypothetical protein
MQTITDACLIRYLATKLNVPLPVACQSEAQLLLHRRKHRGAAQRLKERAKL